MKLAVSGKGGVGKTTLVAILSRLIAADGHQVIAIDADPASNLAAALGVPASACPKPIREMKDLIQERTGSGEDGLGKYFKLNPDVADLPEKFSVAHDGVRLLILGGITKGGGGCACPENALLKALLAHVFVLREDAVVVDMEAGIEHLGRATAAAVDALIVVLEPGRRSVAIAEAIRRLAAEAGIKQVLAVGNKAQTADHRRFLEDAAGGLPWLGCISYHSELAQADLDGRPVFENAPAAVEETREIYRNLIRRIGRVDSGQGMTSGADEQRRMTDR